MSSSPDAGLASTAPACWHQPQIPSALSMLPAHSFWAFTAPVSERASLSSMGPLLGSISQLSSPTGQRLACWSSISGIQHMSGREGTSDLCHMLLALLSWIQKKPNVTQTASAHSRSSWPCWPPTQEITSLYGCSSYHCAAPLSEYGQPLPSKELSLVQRYFLFSWGNGVDRVTDTTSHPSGLNYSRGH